jgi:tetratricopeptide (TPR) repeat protein
VRTAALLVLAVACDCEKKEVDTPPPPEAPVQVRDPEPTAEPVRPVEVTLPAPSEEQLRELRDAVREGRRLAQADDFAGAIARFEAALRIAPLDGALLCELGFVRQRSGDVPGATRDTHKGLERLFRRAPESDRERNTRGSCLYNAGRLAEDAGQADKARGFYTQSLAFRENGTVRGRLEALGGATEASVESLIAVEEEGLVADSLEALHEAWLAEGNEERGDETTIEEDVTIDARRVVILSLCNSMDAEIRVATELDDGWHLSEPIGSYFCGMSALYDGGLGDVEIDEVEVRGAKLLVVRVGVIDAGTNAQEIYDLEGDEFDQALEASSATETRLTVVRLEVGLPFATGPHVVKTAASGTERGVQFAYECEAPFSIEGSEAVIGERTGDEGCGVSLAGPARLPL